MTPRLLNQILKGVLLLITISIVGILVLGDRKLTTIAGETSRLRAMVEVNQQQIKVFEQTQARVESLGYVNDLANKVLPADKEQSAIVAEISEFTKRSNLSIAQITFTDVESTTGATKSTAKANLVIPKGVQVVPVTVQIKAGAKYSDVLEFLKIVENNQRKMQLTSINIKPNIEDRQVLDEVSIMLNLYAKQSTKSGVSR